MLYGPAWKNQGFREPRGHLGGSRKTEPWIAVPGLASRVSTPVLGTHVALERSNLWQAWMWNMRSPPLRYSMTKKRFSCDSQIQSLAAAHLPLHALIISALGCAGLDGSDYMKVGEWSIDRDEAPTCSCPYRPRPEPGPPGHASPNSCCTSHRHPFLQ